MEIKTFSFRAPGITIFGRGTGKETGQKARQLGARKVSVITDRNIVEVGIAEKIVQSLRSVNLEVNLFDEIEGEPNIEMIENCVRVIKEKNPEVIVGLGGGSCMDVAKVVAILLKYEGKVCDYIGTEKVPGKGLPVILLPTTAGTGAEATPNAIVTNKSMKLKQAVVSTYLLPDVAIVDPSFTDTLPSKITAFTGLDAFTHAFECYICKKASPLTDIIALKAIELIAQNLRKVMEKPNNKQARDKLALGSLFGGIVITNSGTGGVHALAYPLGGTFGIPHGLANAIMLPWVSEFNMPACIHKFAQVAEKMGEDTKNLSPEEAAGKTVSAIKKLVEDMPIPSRLRDVGIEKKDIPRLTDLASKVKRLLDNNPRELGISEIRKIYEKAF